MNAGIIGKAETATETYGTEEEKEQIKIAYADYKIAKESGEANPTLDVAGASEVQESDGSWTITFDKTGNVYTLSADGKTITPQGGTSGGSSDEIDLSNIDFEAIKSDVLANKEAYLEKAAIAGQNTSSNTDIGIGADGSVLNMDLWNYDVSNNNFRFRSRGSDSGAYKGTESIQRLVLPECVLISNEFYAVKNLDGTTTYPTIGDDTNILGITDVVLPSTAEKLGDLCYGDCNFLNYYISDNSSYFSSVDGVIYNKNKSDLILCPPGRTTLNIPEGVVTIKIYALGDCWKLTSILIPNSVSSIEEHALPYALKELKIDNKSGAISGAPWGATNAKITYLR